MPFFDLAKIREAASQQRIQYRGGSRSKVRKDIANLGYSLDDVTNCIISLTATDFKKTISYPDQSFDDVYFKNVIREEQSDEIYMKLRLMEDGEIQIVEIGSFHV
ncbi:MAG: type II toxin-antitoxin system MqsR family toxin [Methylococcaceae bacterium]